jgi:squalene synthase HpnC
MMCAEISPSFEQRASKTHKQENFPVASLLIAPKHRPTILSFYRFARAADDVVDNSSLSPDMKLEGLDGFEATLLGQSDAIEAALPLRGVLAEQKLSPRHALDLLQAFRMDAVKNRYADWGELMHYCAFSAAPVGRFVLDVHGESETTWAASDALCSALQIINHLQDCAADYRNLNRVYLPQDLLEANKIGPEVLAAHQASPALKVVLRELTAKTDLLIEEGAKLAPQLKNFRLCLETSVIAKLAFSLNHLLTERDPLSEPVHLSKYQGLAVSLLGIASGLKSFGTKPAQIAASRPSER